MSVRMLACMCMPKCLRLDSTFVLQVLVPTSQFIRSLVAARLAADVLDVPTVLIARTDAHSAALLTSDVDEVDRAFCTGERTPEGFFRVQEGVKVASKLMRCIKLHIAGCSFVAVYHASDYLWFQRVNKKPPVSLAKAFFCAAGIHCQGVGICSIC